MSHISQQTTLMGDLLSSLLNLERTYVQHSHSNICDQRTAKTVVLVFCNVTLVRVNAAVVALRHFHQKIIRAVRRFKDHIMHYMNVVQGNNVLCYSWYNLSANIIQRRCSIYFYVQPIKDGRCYAASKSIDIIKSMWWLIVHGTKTIALADADFLQLGNILQLIYIHTCSSQMNFKMSS